MKDETEERINNLKNLKESSLYPSSSASSMNILASPSKHGSISGAETDDEKFNTVILAYEAGAKRIMQMTSVNNKPLLHNDLLYRRMVFFLKKQLEF